MQILNQQAFVYCGKIPLQEYGVIAESENLVSGYIPSENGKPFEICCGNGLNQNVVVYVTADGYPTYSGVCLSGYFGSVFACQFISDGLSKVLTFRKMQLSGTRQIVSSGNPGDAPPSVPGSITIRVLRAKVTKPHPANSNTVLEGSKKTDGNSTRPKPGQSVYVDLLDSIEKPHATFVFLYRPRDILQAQGIMPHDLTHIPSFSTHQHANDAVNEYLAYLRAQSDAMSAFMNESPNRPWNMKQPRLNQSASNLYSGGRYCVTPNNYDTYLRTRYLSAMMSLSRQAPYLTKTCNGEIKKPHSMLKPPGSVETGESQMKKSPRQTPSICNKSIRSRVHRGRRKTQNEQRPGASTAIAYRLNLTRI